MLPLLHLFCAGDHTDRWGRQYRFTPDCVAEMAQVYDPGVYRAPIQLTHDLALVGGHLGKASVVGEHLVGVPESELAPAFREAAQGKEISLQLFSPEAADNPVPGAWGIAHVALEDRVALELLPPQFSRDKAMPVFCLAAPGFTPEQAELAQVRRELKRRDIRARLEAVAFGGADGTVRVPPSCRGDLEELLVSLDAATPVQFSGERTMAPADWLIEVLIPNLAGLVQLGGVVDRTEPPPQFGDGYASPDDIRNYVAEAARRGEKITASEACRRLLKGVTK